MTDTERRIIYLLRKNPEQAESLQQILTGQEPPSLDQIEEKILSAGGDVKSFIRQLDDSGIIDGTANPAK